MKYINMDDLTTIIQNRLLIESIEKEEEILAGIEDLVISEVCAYIGGRYDVGKIFGDPPITSTSKTITLPFCQIRSISLRRVP